ncbi:MAG: ArgE/DapE family deacylase [Gemmatimonadota bacterium]
MVERPTGMMRADDDRDGSAPRSGPAAVEGMDPGAAAATTLAAALVAVPSVNPALEEGGAGEAKLAELTAEWLADWGFAVDRVEGPGGRPSVVGRLARGAGPRLVLNGHLDTVGVEGMTVAPYGGEVRGGRLYGRGAADMKGGVAALLAAARDAAREAGGPSRGELIVTLVADEEHASEGMRAVLDAGLDADAAIVCEPTSLAVAPAHKGFVWLEVEFRGRAAHGSRPARGIDAIRHAGRFLARLDAIESTIVAGPPHPLLGHGSVHAGTIAGGSAPSVYPDRCRVVLERRTLPGETAADARAEVEALLRELAEDVPELDARVEVRLARPGTEAPSDSAIVHALEAALEAEGRPPRTAPMTAWVDAALLNRAGIPAVCFGPGDIEAAHSPDESVDVAEVETAHRVLRRLIGRFPS